MMVYFGTPLYNLAVCFQNFIFTKFRLQYKTRSATNDNGGLVLSYFPDVDYLEGQGYSGTAPFVEEADLVTSSNTVTVPYYRDYTMNVPILVNRTAPKYFTRNEYTATNVGYNLDNAGDTGEDRQTFQGMVIVSGSTGGAANGYLWGDLYLSYTIHLGDIAEPATTAIDPAPIKRLKRQLKCLGVPFEQKRVEPISKLHKPKLVRSDISGLDCKHRVDPEDQGLDIEKESKFIDEEMLAHQATESSGKDEMSTTTVGHMYEDELPVEGLRALTLARTLARSRSRSTSRPRK